MKRTGLVFLLPLLFLAAGCARNMISTGEEKKTMTAYPLTTLRLSSWTFDTPEKRARIFRMLDKYGSVDEVWLCSIDGIKSFAEHKKDLEHFKKFAEGLRKRGIAVTVQLTSTVGHFGGAGTEKMGVSLTGEKSPFPWTEDDLLVGHDGLTAPGSCCPSSPRFAQWCGDVLALYCKELQPLAAYIDDDLRFHSHGPIEQACCCRRCLDRFSKMTGRKWTRAQVQKMLESKKDQPMRRQWVELHTQIMADFCRTAGEKIHAVSPKTHLGLQTQHAKLFYTCWDFSPVYKAMKESTGLPARVRIGGGSWNDFTPQFIARKSFISGCDIDDARACGSVDLVTCEEECYPRTVMNKTAHAKALESALHLASGGNSLSYHTNELWEDRDAVMEEVFRMLETWRPLFERLRDLAAKYRFDGVTALFQDGVVASPDHGIYKWFMFWAEESEELHLATLPVRLSKRASQEGGNPGFLTQEAARGMTKETFDRFLRSGIVMTGNAYLELQKLGLTKEFGVKGAPSPFSVARFLTGPGKGATLRLAGQKAVGFTFGKNCKAEPLLALTRTASDAPDAANGRISVGAWRLETPKGRIAVVGAPGNFSRYLSGYALDLYRDLFDWVGARPVSVRLEEPVSAVLIPLADEKGRLRAVSILNSGIEPRTGLKLHVRRPFGVKGAWLQAGKPAVTLRGKKAKDGSAVFTLPELGAWQFSLLELE